MHLERTLKKYRLRQGVFITPDRDNRIYIGLPHRGVSLAVPEGVTQKEIMNNLHLYFQISQDPIPQDLEEFARRNSLKEYSWDEQIIAPFIESCLQLKLIDEVEENAFLETNCTMEMNSAHSIFFQQLYHPERSLESWRGGKNTDDLLNRRSLTRIAIYGENRLAVALIPALINSGYQLLHLSPRAPVGEIDRENPSNHSRKKKPQINDRITTNHLCGMGATVGDVGVSYSHFVNTHIENTGWSFARPSKKETKPDAIIATTQPHADHLQQWMSDSIPHLIISNIFESFVEIGPFVIPGKTPCYRCINLWKIDLIPHAQRAMIDLLNCDQQEMPIGAVAMISGHLILSLNTYLSKDESCLSKSNSIRINLFDPCSPTHIAWQPHSLCGCMDLD